MATPSLRVRARRNCVQTSGGHATAGRLNVTSLSDTPETDNNPGCVPFPPDPPNGCNGWLCDGPVSDGDRPKRTHDNRITSRRGNRYAVESKDFGVINGSIVTVDIITRLADPM